MSLLRKKVCKENYPEVIKELRKIYLMSNTESAEQTFVWLGKYKKKIEFNEQA